jgi:4-methyl-5(b-hydroxyethyl)-thiazole monophosphate biosynthesis
MVIILLADGFEEIEALTPLDMLRRAGIRVATVSISDELEVTGAHGITVLADITKDSLDLYCVDFAIFPGGMPGAKNLDECDFTDKVIDAILKNGGRLAAICAAPMILGHRGLLKGKSACCYPGFENELTGARISYEPCVTDGNITTARGMGAALDFAEELVSLTAGCETSRKISEAIIREVKK